MRTKLFFFILLCSFSATAQNSNSGAYSNFESTANGLTRMLSTLNENNPYRNNKNSNNYNGSPYLDEEFQAGSLTKIDSNTYHDLKLRYNIYKDHIEFLDKENIQIVPGENFTQSAIIGDKTFKLSNYFIKKKEKLGYLEQITKGSCNLYYKHKVNFKDATKAKPFTEAEPAEFVNLSGKFFIQHSNARIISINSKKHLLEQLANNKKEIQKFLKTEKINLKKKEDFIKLVQYYNGLNKSSN